MGAKEIRPLKGETTMKTNELQELELDLNVEELEAKVAPATSGAGAGLYQVTPL
jgi:hypothetical protein